MNEAKKKKNANTTTDSCISAIWEIAKCPRRQNSKNSTRGKKIKKFTLAITTTQISLAESSVKIQKEKRQLSRYRVWFSKTGNWIKKKSKQNKKKYNERSKMRMTIKNIWPK